MDFPKALRALLPAIKAVPEWGIESVPQNHRILGFGDFFVLWGNLGIGLLVMLAGTFLVPGLGLASSLVAIAVGNALGCLLLAQVGRLGSESGLPTMVLFRSVLGRRGSWLPTALNILQLLGWTTFEFIVMGVAADAIGKKLFGLSLYPLWTSFFALFVLLLGFGGPIGVVRQWLEKFAVWVAAATGIWLCYRLLTSWNLSELWRKKGDGSLPFWVAVDLVIALPISWLPLVADYNRFAKEPRRAFWGTALGFFTTGSWFIAMGAILMLGAGIKQEPKDFTTTIALIAGWVALLILLADETHNAWADLYSTVLSIQNIRPKARQRPLLALVCALCLALALVIDVTQYQSFLYLIGSFFIPLFAVLLAHRLLTRNNQESLSPEAGPAVRAAALAAWAIGFAVYQLANPGVIGAFFDAWNKLVPASLGVFGASIPSFIVAFIVYTGVYEVLSRSGKTKSQAGV